MVCLECNEEDIPFGPHYCLGCETNRGVRKTNHQKKKGGKGPRRNYPGWKRVAGGGYVPDTVWTPGGWISPCRDCHAFHSPDRRCPLFSSSPKQ